MNDALPKPRLPNGTPSFEWMISDSIYTVASRETPYEEAARLFGDRYGFVLALTDAFRDDPSRRPELRRGFDLARGLLARAKKILQDAWDERSGPVVKRGLDDLLGETAPRSAPRPAVPPDPFASTATIIRKVDRDERTKAAVQFANTWAVLRHAQVVLRERREALGENDRELADAAIRSAGRWSLDLEEAWCARTFEELLGEPTIGELLLLVFPPEPS